MSYKLILKTADKTLETRLIDNPALAAHAWAEMRGKTEHDGQALDLIAACGSTIFLRHRFSAEAQDMFFVPSDFDPTELFFLALAGAASQADVPRRATGRPRSGQGIDWDSVDWELSNAEIASGLGVSPQAVDKQRRKRFPSPPAKS